MNIHCTARANLGWCTASTYTVALLVPFRNRERTIGIFLRHMIPFILRQRLEFGIFVIEQTDSLKFNRAMLMNVGFLEALKFEEWDCIVIHDVDFIPHYDDNSYTCHSMPRHFLSGLAKRPKVKDFEFNGVTGFTVRQYRLMNGAPNRYWGWGGEDHELRTRAELQKWKIYRTNYPYGFYDHIPHKVHARNETEDNWPQFNKEVAEWQFRDGLNNIQYSQPEVTVHPLFVKIEVALSELKIKAAHPRSKKKT
ncbi:putative beta-1,4-galactosyltransferase 6 [Apostichopus japonicus]|uniref:Putative beta-1,4-galactosyltransferase 6 n=1 Tax=Stichopus japonicus TaxID=307972 RepID=A0A2G8K4T8_STIJA|nr:putative beta-1,4-galactosyltransferase 6 [Apostichopus japonicus]